MKDVNTKKLKRVHGKTLLATVDASKMKHTGYCGCPDGTDIKPFEFFNAGRGFQERFFWEVCGWKHPYSPSLDGRGNKERIYYSPPIKGGEVMFSGFHRDARRTKILD